MSFESISATCNSLPLLSVPTVVLDTETTGLDTTKDRIVQIGAVRIQGGQVAETEIFNRLVNPECPIPSVSTGIHGISDADVAQEAVFTEAMSELSGWLGASLLVGFSTGFDVAVLQAEHKRVGLVWRAPRFLDVQDLLMSVAPQLPQYSMEVAAEWLNVKIEGRHTALGDARATAQIYLALVPLLAERGIVTLGQVDRVVQRASRRSQLESAGWATNDASTLAPAEFAAVDSYPYRHRVRDVMRKPSQFIDAEKTLGQALTVMMEQQISSVFLPADVDATNIGILTERDVLRAIDRDGQSALTKPVGHYGVRPLVCVGQDEFLYRAIVEMSTRGFRHLGVNDTANQVVGALSARDLLKQRASGAVALGHNIAQAQSVAELGEIWPELTRVAAALVAEEVDARDIAAIISRELRELTRRAAALAEQELVSTGAGRPPCAYALLVLGSGGRGESLLAMDQDNAIVYEVGEPGDATDQWFERFGSRIADILNSVGVPYCSGGVMAKNAAWRKGMVQWSEAVQQWIVRADGKDILNADIFFDCRSVRGEAGLGEKVYRAAIDVAVDARNFQRALASNAAQFESPFGFLGRFRLSDGRLDLKKTGLFPIVATARVLALRNGNSERSTLNRLVSAKQNLPEQVDTIDALISAHRILLRSVLGQQLRDLDRGLRLN
ncbi:MAG: DUF294 nucleotidyltransferase-like domain-containing protein, partial [Pseudomonadota bacterium]